MRFQIQPENVPVVFTATAPLRRTFVVVVFEVSFEGIGGGNGEVGGGGGIIEIEKEGEAVNDG